jgi:hypothetical protein
LVTAITLIGAIGVTISCSDLDSHLSVIDASPNAYPGNGFGGYILPVSTVTSVSAKILVPVVVPHTRPGWAGTWIAVEGPQSNFIQIGINEESIGGTGRFEAFWSDTAKRYEAQNLGSVAAAQVIDTSLTFTATGWEMKLRDENGSLLFKKTIAYGGDLRFDAAEWIEEDPPPTLVSSVDTPFPEMTPNRFSDLKENGLTPQLTLKDALALIPSKGSIQVPTALRHDSFTFVAPYGQGLTYLEDVRSVDSALSSFDVAIHYWKSTTTLRQKKSVDVLATSLNAFATNISKERWPASSQTAVTAELREVSVLVTDLNNWSNDGLKIGSPTWKIFNSGRDSFVNHSHAVRRTLQLPYE